MRTPGPEGGRALLALGGEKYRPQWERVLKENGFSQVETASNGGEARRLLLAGDWDLLLIAAPLPDEFGHELALHAVELTHAGVILLAKAGTAEQVADTLQGQGVLVLSKPFTALQFRQAVQMAASCYHRMDGLRAENDRLADKIAQLRLVDRAKCFLIERRGMTEAAAHRMIEKQAMDSRRSRGEIAQEILEQAQEED